MEVNAELAIATERERMVAENPRSGASPSEELLRHVREITEGVTQAPVSDLPAILGRLLEAAHQAVGGHDGTVVLLDYAFDEMFALGTPFAEVVRQKLSNLTDPSSPSSREFRTVEPAEGTWMVRMPVVAGSREVGLLCLTSQNGDLELSGEQRYFWETLAGLAAVALERRQRQRDQIRLREWLDALAKVFAASRASGELEDVDRLLQTIAESALQISGADFVVLYEYFEEQRDIRLPPTLSGKTREEAVLRGRGVVLEHRKSAVFRLLGMKFPFFAENAPSDWASAGLVPFPADPQERTFFRREEVVSSAGITLRVDEEKVGLLFVNYRTPHLFSQEFREHLTLFANHAALAIGNTRAFLNARRYSESLEALNQIGRGLGAAVTRDIEQIGQLIDEQTRTVVPSQNFLLCLYDAELDQFSLPYLRDQYNSAEDLLPQLHQGLAAYVCRSGEALLVNRDQQSHLFALGDAQLVGRCSVIWLGVPLLVRDTVIGALVVQDYENEAAFNDKHERLLKTVASQAAIAVDNFRLLRDATLRSQELLALLDISQAFGTGQMPSTELFSAILDHVCEITACDGSLLLLVDPGDTTLLRVVASSSQLQENIGRNLRRGEGVSGRVADTGSAYLVNDYAQWSGRSSFFAATPKRVCAIPLAWHGDVIGVMTLVATQERGDFSLREIEVLQRFAGPMTAAVQNARDSSLRNALIHAGPNAIVAVDTRGRIITLNEEAATLFKYTQTALLGQEVSQLYWKGFGEAHRIDRLLTRNGKIRDEEVFGRSKNDERLPLSLTAALIRDRDEVLGSVGVLQDLRLHSLPSRTQLLVEALEEISQEEDLSQIGQTLTFSAVEILYADAGCFFLREKDTFALHTTHRANPALCDSLAAGSAQARLAAWVARDPRQIIRLPQQEYIGEFRLRPESRSAILVPVRTDERLLGCLLIESSVPEHFKSEEGNEGKPREQRPKRLSELVEILAAQAAVTINRIQLLRYRKATQEGLLVSANAIAVGQIATGFIHEAKNALNGMTLTVHNLADDIESEPNLKAKRDYVERLTLVLSEMRRLDDLSRRFQRFTQQGLRPEKREVYLNDVVTATVQLLGSVLRKKQMRLDLRLDASLDKPHGKSRGNPIQLDESQIQQVIINLILNAVAASPERSPLLVETRNHGGTVEIRITDRGTGIADDDKRKLFTPFFTTKKEGVGLGLYISKLLVEESHGGAISIEHTAPGKGTDFSVRLPVRS
jgi:PAS domain S-box-containing protein